MNFERNIERKCLIYNLNSQTTFRLTVRLFVQPIRRSIREMPPRKRKASPAAVKGNTEVDKNEQEEKAADISAGDELKSDENGSLEVGSDCRF